MKSERSRWNCAAPPCPSEHRRLQPPSRAILLSTLVGVLLAIPGAMVALHLRGDPPPGVSAIAEVTVIADFAAGGCVPSKHGGARAEHR